MNDSILKNYKYRFFIKEIEEMWSILCGDKNNLLEIKDIKLAFMTLNIIVNEIEVERLMKDRKYSEDSKISIEEFKEIAILKFKLKNQTLDLQNTIDAFKNENNIFNRENILDIVNNINISSSTFNSSSDSLNSNKCKVNSNKSNKQETEDFKELDFIKFEKMKLFFNRLNLSFTDNELKRLISNCKNNPFLSKDHHYSSNNNYDLNINDIRNLYRNTNLI